jgi:ribosomal protein S18 acetylase RimI-like enzyme
MAGSDPWVRLGRGIEACREAVLRPGLVLFVARAEGVPLGFALLHPRGAMGSPYLASIAVEQKARGRAIGRQLIEFAEGHFRPGSRHMFLCVSSFNVGARRLYERLGYRAVGELEDYVVDGASEILMHKWLRR